MSPPNARREAICLALAAAEVSWLAVVFTTVAHSGERHRPLLLWLGLLVLMLGFFYAYRALARANLSTKLQQGLLALEVVLAVLLFVRGHVYAGLDRQGVDWLSFIVDRLSSMSVLLADEVVVALLIILLWGRGIHLARRSLSTTSVGFTFRAGVVILFWFCLFSVLLDRRDLTLFVLLYFFFALVAVALARIEEVSQLPGGSQARFSGYWIGSSLAAVGIVLWIGALVAAFVYSGGLQPLLRLLTPIFVLVVGLLVVLAIVVFGLLEWISAALSVDWGGLGQLFQDIVDRLNNITDILPSQESAGLDPAFLRTTQLATSLLLIFGLIAFIVLITWVRLRRAAGGGPGETRESVLSPAALAQGLLDLLQAGRQRVADGLAALGRLGSATFLAALSIRRIYAHLLILAAVAGYPRAAAQTPYEYLPTLQRAFPGSKDEVALITRAYVNAHYGKLPDTPDELQHIHDAWDRVRARSVGAKHSR